MFNGFPRPSPDVTKGIQLKSLQSGSTTISAGVTQVDVIITAVDLTRAVVFATAAGSSFNRTPVAFLQDATTLRFERYDTANATDVDWYVIELTGLVSVQSGVTEWDNAATKNVTISAVDLAKAWLVMTFAIATAGGTSVPRGRISTSTNVAFNRVSSGIDLTKVAWFVVEFG